MDTSRLRAAVEHVIHGYRETALSERLGSLVAAAASLLSSPSNADYLMTFKATLADFQKAAVALEGRTLPVGAERVLHAIGASSLLPERLREAVMTVVSGTAPTLAYTHSELVRIHNATVAAITVLQQLTDALGSVGIKAYQVPAGEVEIGVFLPSTLTHDDFEKVESQMEEWRMVFRTMQEVGTGRVQTIRMTGAEWGSFDFHVAFDLEGAKAFLLMLGGIVYLFGRIAQFKKTREHLVEQKMPQSMLDIAEQEESKVKEVEIAKIVDRVLEKASSRIEATRKNELRNQVEVSVRFVTDSLGYGVRVEVLPPPPPPAASDSNIPPGPEQSIKPMVATLESGMRRLERGEALPPELAAPQNPSSPSTTTG